MSTGLTTISDAKLDALEAAAGEYTLTDVEQLPTFKRTIKVAQWISKVRRAFSNEILDAVLELRGSKLGFRDDGGNYSRELIRDILIEGKFRGAEFVGNEINIIGGNLYLTKEFYERLVFTCPRITELAIDWGVPAVLGDRGALVPAWARFKIDGHDVEVACCQTDDRDTRIAVRVNKGMGVDAIIGKAKRKMYARIWARVSGARWAEADGSREEPEAVEVEGQVETSES